MPDSEVSTGRTCGVLCVASVPRTVAKSPLADRAEASSAAPTAACTGFCAAARKPPIVSAR